MTIVDRVMALALLFFAAVVIASRAHEAGRSSMCRDVCAARGTTHYLVTEKYKCQCAPVHKWRQP